MPFTEPEDRLAALHGFIKQVGDLCFLEYQPLKLEWDAERRWTTAHNQTKKIFRLTDGETARYLAWAVHFVLNVIPYEIEKRKENGDVKLCNKGFRKPARIQYRNAKRHKQGKTSVRSNLAPRFKTTC